MLSRLFPYDRALVFGAINLDEAAQAWVTAHGDGADFGQPAAQAKAVSFTHQRLGITASYGGWLERRDHVFHGTYLRERSTFLHLGCDFNVPERTGVCTPWAGRVVLVDCDSPEPGGWGTRVALQLAARDEVVLFAHLSPNAPVSVGDELRAGEIVGSVGVPEHNGGWYPHLHLQRIVGRVWRTLFPGRLDQLDGYGHALHEPELALAFPDPLALLLTL